MRYVLLLRGINVGGKNKVSMNDLKMNIGELGYQNVVTYINSGNVIFDTDDNIETVKIKIAEMLKNVFFSYSICYNNKGRISGRSFKSSGMVE